MIYFLTCAVFKYAREWRRWTAGVEMKIVSLSTLVYLFQEMSTIKKKKIKRGASSTHGHGLQSVSPWKQHKDILFCFASFPILSRGMEGRENKNPELESSTLVCSEALLSNLTGRFQCEFKQHTGSPKKTYEYGIFFSLVDFLTSFVLFSQTSGLLS